MAAENHLEANESAALERGQAGTHHGRFLVQLQPSTEHPPGDALIRHTATLAEAKEVADEICGTAAASDARVFITDEQTGEQFYRGQDGSWMPMSGRIDYGSDA